VGTLLVDPAAQEVTAIDIEADFLDELRRHIGCAQLTVIPVAVGRFAVWADNLGLLKPGRHFWRFSDSEFRFAGKCVITGIAENGTPVPLSDDATPEMVAESIVWVPPDDLERIIERVVIIDQDGVKVPAIAREVIWKSVPDVTAMPEHEPAGSLGWTVTERDDGTFKAEQFRLNGGDRLELMAMFAAPSLKELRAKLPAGLTRKEPAENAPDNVVEHWVG
jgi:hypothetical protein